MRRPVVGRSGPIRAPGGAILVGRSRRTRRAADGGCCRRDGVAKGGSWDRNRDRDRDSIPMPIPEAISIWSDAHRQRSGRGLKGPGRRGAKPAGSWLAPPSVRDLHHCHICAIYYPAMTFANRYIPKRQDAVALMRHARAQAAGVRNPVRASVSGESRGARKKIEKPLASSGRARVMCLLVRWLSAVP